MFQEIFCRNIMFLGEEGFERLQKSFVAVVGLGGVGSYASEALARAGVGKMRIIDCDMVKSSNVNRQLIALSTNLNRPKVEVSKERLLSINPEIQLDARQAFCHKDTIAQLISPDLNFVVDAIDSLNPKIGLIQYCMANHIPIISAMGAAARFDPMQIRIGMMDDTSFCPFARMIRKKLRARKTDTSKIPVVYSIEPVRELANTPHLKIDPPEAFQGRPRPPLPSIPTIPGIFGLIAANYVIQKLTNNGQWTNNG